MYRPIIGIVGRATKDNEDKSNISTREEYRKAILDLGGIPILILPPQDMYYYVAALISIGIAILSFYNIIAKLNILTTRKLPQLGRRGGDENA